MEISRVYAMYFSGTGTTEKIVTRIAETIAEGLTPGKDITVFDFTSPSARKMTHDFGEGDLVVFGVPTYAGRVPNVLLPYIKDGIRADNAIAVPVVMFGNRDFDDSLIELEELLVGDGFKPVAAAAFVGEHAFSYKLAAGRPDELDMKTAVRFAVDAAVKIKTMSITEAVPVRVSGQPLVRPYYTPRDRNGDPIDIRKVKPVTGDECDRCGICAEVCPMGSIPKSDPSRCDGICIKCGACVKKCPLRCKTFTDEKYLYHMHELEEMYARRAEPATFL
ncbi:MAG: ferredoxin [Eubacterium sp.]|nr:ferredoxin [Eubacterium sp.]